MEMKTNFQRDLGACIAREFVKLLLMRMLRIIIKTCISWQRGSAGRIREDQGGDLEDFQMKLDANHCFSMVWYG